MNWVFQCALRLYVSYGGGGLNQVEGVGIKFRWKQQQNMRDIFYVCVLGVGLLGPATPKIEAVVLYVILFYKEEEFIFGVGVVMLWKYCFTRTNPL